MKGEKEEEKWKHTILKQSTRMLGKKLYCQIYVMAWHVCTIISFRTHTHTHTSTAMKHPDPALQLSTVINSSGHKTLMLDIKIQKVSKQWELRELTFSYGNALVDYTNCFAFNSQFIPQLTFPLLSAWYKVTVRCVCHGIGFDLNFMRLKLGWLVLIDQHLRTCFDIFETISTTS